MKEVFRIAFSIILVVILVALSGFASSENSTWDCSVCGRTGNTGRFCGECGHPAEDNSNPNDSTRIVASSDSPWPVRNMEESPVSLKRWSKNTKHQAYLGPGKEYAGGGSFGAEKKGITAILLDNEYILVKIDNRFVYFPETSVNGAPEDEIELVEYPAVTTAKVQPMLGPGNDYDPLRKIQVHKKPSKPTVPGGDETPDEGDGSGTEPGDGSPSDEGPSGEGPSGEEPSSEGPSGEGPSGESPSGEGPSGEGPSGEGASGEGPSDGSTGDGSTGDGSTGDGSTGDGTPGGDANTPEPGTGGGSFAKTSKVSLNEGTEIKVFFETDGWVYAEFKCKAGLVRAWIPAKKVRGNRAINP